MLVTMASYIITSFVLQLLHNRAEKWQTLLRHLVMGSTNVLTRSKPSASFHHGEAAVEPYKYLELHEFYQLQRGALKALRASAGRVYCFIQFEYVILRSTSKNAGLKSSRSTGFFPAAVLELVHPKTTGGD
jgi:hypothetical protein